MEMKFYRCAHCGQIIAKVKDNKVPVICCGEAMKEIIPNISDGAFEKHVPIITREGDKVIVRVGEVDHPMIEQHYIEWIALKTKCGNQRKELKPGDEPKKCFRVCENDEIIAAYAYCNLHSLFKKEVK